MHGLRLTPHQQPLAPPACPASRPSRVAFVEAQETVCALEYWYPSQEWCTVLQCRHGLTKAALFDALVMHGQGANSSGTIERIVEAATAAAGGTPATGVDEAVWLEAFLAARKDLMLEYDGQWADDAARPDYFLELLERGAPAASGLYSGL